MKATTANHKLCNDFFDAIERNDLDAVADCYAPDMTMWVNLTGTEMPREENLEVLLRDTGQRQHAYDRFPILGERRKQLAGLLSGGEQQMLSLAPALAEPPAVFIADEPTLGLAPLAAEVVIDAIRDRQLEGTTFN